MLPRLRMTTIIRSYTLIRDLRVFCILIRKEVFVNLKLDRAFNRILQDLLIVLLKNEEVGEDATEAEDDNDWIILIF